MWKIAGLILAIFAATAPAHPQALVPEPDGYRMDDYRTLVPETLALLARQVGFKQVDTRFLNPPERTADVPPEVAEILFAPLDYAIVAVK